MWCDISSIKVCRLMAICAAVNICVVACVEDCVGGGSVLVCTYCRKVLSDFLCGRCVRIRLLQHNI